jgi:hypothetical protein
MESSKKILPIVKSEMNLYNNHSNMMSIILNHPEPIEWIYCNYIQLFIERKLVTEGSGWSDFWFDFKLFPSCPFIFQQKIKYDLVNTKWSKISDFIIDCINLNYYSIVVLNTFFISQYYNYQELHRKHEVFIYGYDKSEKVFYCADFFEGGLYSYKQVPFDEINNSYVPCEKDVSIDYVKGICLLEYEPANDFKYYKGFIVKGLREYLLLDKPYYMSPQDEMAFGIDFYTVLQDYIKVKSDGNIFSFDIRPFQVIYEHKRMMLKRLKFLMERNEISSVAYDSISADYKEIENKTVIIRNLMIKSTMSRNLEYRMRAINLVAHRILCK